VHRLAYNSFFDRHPDHARSTENGSTLVKLLSISAILDQTFKPLDCKAFSYAKMGTKDGFTEAQFRGNRALPEHEAATLRNSGIQ
jgi:hypothetical protein